MNNINTLALNMTEGELKTNILDTAAKTGWLVHHDRPAQYQSGRYATHIEGDVGFPDLVMVHVKHFDLIIVELKNQRAKPTPEQVRWLKPLAGGNDTPFNENSGVWLVDHNGALVVGVWQPIHWLNGTIQHYMVERYR